MCPLEYDPSICFRMKSSYLLDVNGPADPTGCGEGFSYIRISAKTVFKDSEQNKCINVKKVDLRQLGVVDAKKLLKSAAVPESQYKKLSRWEMIDVIKTLSNEKGGGDMGSNANPISRAEILKRNKQDRQTIFDVQNRVLSSSEVLTSDEEEDSDASDIEEAGKQLEEMLQKDVAQAELDLEAEERERFELMAMLLAEKKIGEPEENVKKSRMLKIHRTIQKAGGGSVTYTETVTNQEEALD